MLLSSIFILKRRFHRQHCLGLFINFLAILLVGISSRGPHVDPLMTFFLFISILLKVIQLTIEERFYRKYKLKPVQLAGYEGIFGIIFQSIRLLAGVNGMFDNFGLFISNTFQTSAGNFFLVLAYFILNTLSTYTGQLIIKKISAMTRALSDCNSLFLNGIILMIANLFQFKWYFILYYAICIKGTLLFCEILVYPCLGFNKNSGHGVRETQYGQIYNNLIYPQYYSQGGQYQNLNNAGGNNIVVLIHNIEGDNQLRQPLFQQINLESNQQQPRPSNVQNQIGIIKEEQRDQPQQQQFPPSNVQIQNNQYPNQQERLIQNLAIQPQNQQLSYQDFATIKQILKEIKSMKFEKLTQIKQIIALIEDVDKKIPLSENSLKQKIAKILQQMANILTKNYSNTIKMKMAKLIQEDQYSDVSKINEMRYIQDRMYFIVNNNNITTNCIKEIINWIEKDLQSGEFEQATQKLQQINDQFLNEQERDQQQSDSNWGENYETIQQKIKLI
ncbi:hypothetical protein ABPG73_022356 [Tetrahymena malaccensis]